MVSRYLKQYFNNIVSRVTGKIIEYTFPRTGIELVTLAVIGNECILLCIMNENVVVFQIKEKKICC